jgi:hypothetical protein
MLTVDFDGTPIDSGFRVAYSSGLAGGPVELEFSVEITGPGTWYLLISADRMRHRPHGFTFTATFATAAFEDVPLTDPMASLPNFGGPAGVVAITAGQPWRQLLLLNNFVRLEMTLDLLAPGAEGQLIVHCQRALPLARSEDAALMVTDAAPTVTTQLSLTLRRDDAELVALVEELLAAVQDGPAAQRERPLARLLSLRTPLAVTRWRTLRDHPDPLVAERVRQTLSTSGL